MFLVMMMFVFPQIGQAAEGSTSIYLDGKALEISKNAQVQNMNGTIMIPIRVVVEELGFNVNWEKQTRTVTIQQSGTEVKLVVNQSTANVNGNPVTIQVAPKLITDTVIVPLRFISEQLGLTVGWDDQTKTVSLVSPPKADSGSNSNTGSNDGIDAELANVQGISFNNNQLMIAVDDENVTPSVFKIANPDRIVVDLPNTVFASTFGNNQYLDSGKSGYFDVNEYPDVAKIRYSLFNNNPSTVRVVIDLNSAKDYQLIHSDGLIIVDLNVDSNTLPPVSNGNKIVVLDAGHGGSDPGAISVTKKKEKDFNLAVTLKVYELLMKESKIDVVLTRDSDTYPTLQERAKLANDLNADIFISIHANAGSATASGVETYYTRSESLSLANVMHKYLVSSSGLTDRKVRTKNLHVTRETKMPAVLLEFGYLSNKSDDALLATEDFRNRVAEGVAQGIKEYLGL